MQLWPGSEARKEKRARTKEQKENAQAYYVAITYLRKNEWFPLKVRVPAGGIYFTWRDPLSKKNKVFSQIDALIIQRTRDGTMPVPT